MALKPFKLATFNLRNLQTPNTPMYPGMTPYEEEEYEAKVEWIADQIESINADVIGFQELWSAKALEDALGRLVMRSPEMTYKLIADDDISNGIYCALAFKQTDFSLDGTPEWITDYPDEFVLKKRKGRTNERQYRMFVDIDNFSRPVLKASLKTKFDDRIVTFFVAHFKSKLPMRLDREEYGNPSIKTHAIAIGTAMSGIRRLSEAGALRVILDNFMTGNDRPVVVMGDMNNGEYSVTLDIVANQPSYRQYFSSHAAKNNDKGLYSSAVLEGFASRKTILYSHCYEKDDRKELLDHILVSQEFYDHSKKRVWSFKEMKVINDHLYFNPKRSSDHGIVVSTFLYAPASNPS